MKRSLLQQISRAPIRSRVRRGLGLLALSGFVCAADAQFPASPSLTNIAQVIELGTNVPASPSPIARVRGVVIYVSSAAQRLYLQDGTNGIQVNLKQPVANFEVGQLVEARGEVEPNLPLPDLRKATAEILGRAPLPTAPFIPPRDLLAGVAPFRWVRTHGYVRDMVTGSTALTMLNTYEGLPFEVIVPTNSAPLPREWLDARIEITGISYPIFNSFGRVTSFRFHAPAVDMIRVVEPGPGKLFDRPLLTLAEAAQIPEQWGPRFRVAGTVVLHRGNSVYLRDDGGAMLVKLQSPLARPAGGAGLEHEPQTPLEPGELIEAIGVRHNWFSIAPTLLFAEYRRVGRGTVPPPRRVSSRDLEQGRHAGELVSIEARLLDLRGWRDVNGSHEALTLQAGELVFQANWDSETAAEWPLKPDSYLRVTGVNEAESGKVKSRPTFRLLMRSPNDVVTIPEPPVWTQPQIWKPVAAGALVAAIAAAWIVLQRWQLRRLEQRVAERTAELRTANEQLKEQIATRERAEIEVQRALAQEKQLSELKSRFVAMVSHEFRTPLGIITSSAEILDAYYDRLSVEDRHENLRDITDATRQMARMMEEVLLLGRVEAGKMTCKPGPLDLLVFGHRLADEVTSATNARCPIQFIAAAGLAEAQADESLLRHIFTNLLANASKYSAPGSPVEFRIEARGHVAVFTVRDRGIGIPQEDLRQLFQVFHRGRNVGDTPGTGLGMTIVKRCVELHGGKIALESAEGRGTTFTVALPLFGASHHNGEVTTEILRAAAGDKSLVLPP